MQGVCELQKKLSRQITTKLIKTPILKSTIYILHVERTPYKFRFTDFRICIKLGDDIIINKIVSLHYQTMSGNDAYWVTAFLTQHKFPHKHFESVYDNLDDIDYIYESYWPKPTYP